MIEDEKFLDDLETQVLKICDQEDPDKIKHPWQQPPLLAKAQLILEFINFYAECTVHYLVAAEVALGQVVPRDWAGGDKKEDRIQRQLLGRLHRARARESHLPAVKRYYIHKAKYLEYLSRHPGTAFYPGRPRRGTPKRQAWRPMPRAWEVDTKDGKRRDAPVKKGQRGVKRTSEELHEQQPRPPRTSPPVAPSSAPTKPGPSQPVDGAEGNTEYDVGLSVEQSPPDSDLKPNLKQVRDTTFPASSTLIP